MDYACLNSRAAASQAAAETWVAGGADTCPAAVVAADHFWNTQAICQQAEKATTKITMKGAVVASDLNGDAVVQECEAVEAENAPVETSPEMGKEMTMAIEGAVQGKDNAVGDDAPVSGQWIRYCPAAGDVEMQKGPEHQHCCTLHLGSL